MAVQQPPSIRDLMEQAQQLKAVFDERELVADSVNKDSQRLAESQTEELRQLQKEHSQLTSAIQSLRTEACSSEDGIFALQQQLEVVEGRVRVLQEHVTAAAHAARSAEQEVEDIGTGVAQRESEVKQRLGALQAAVDLYRARLGMDIQKAPDGVLLVFTHINRSNPQEPFVLGLSIKDGNQYNVTRCEPPLDSSLPQLLAALNSGGDFGTFVKSVRAGFKALAA